MAEPKYTCILEGCGRAAYKESMCQSHAARVKKYGSPIRPCEGCGNDIPMGTPGNRTLCDKCRVCSYPGCGREQRRYGYCNSHSGRINRNGNLSRKCLRCSNEIPIESGVGTRYCSDNCLAGECSVDGCERTILAFDYCKPHYRRFKSTGHPLRKCAGCEGYIPATVPGRKRYCSDQCKDTCLAPGCSEISRDMGYCGRHGCTVRRYGTLPDLDFDCGICGKSVTREHVGVHQKVNRQTCDECTVLKNRDHQKYRRMIIASGYADCGICGDPIDLGLKWPDSGSLSIDHIVPITRGGTNREQNLQPAHAGCNMKKRNWLAPPIDGVLTLI